MTLISTQRSLLKRSSSTAINILTTLVVIAALINLTNGFKPMNAEGRKLFGGYRITPKHCRATKTLPSSDPRAKGPTICMFNHECAQRNGEVVGACMDGFLFGACCQVPSNQQTESTLINDAQNSYYHQYQNHKLQQQESETNKIVSQAYETFGENSAQQQSLENSQAQDTVVYGGGNNVSENEENLDRLPESQQQETSEQTNASTADSSSTESTQQTSASLENDSNLQSSTETQTKVPQPTQSKPQPQPPKFNVHKDSVKISSPSHSPQNDDFVLQVLNTLTPEEASSIVTFTTEIPTKISNSLTQHTSSESSSFEEEPSAVTASSNINQQVVHHTDFNNHEQLFGGGVTFSHSDITHPGADADLIEDDLQFSTGYGPQPVIVQAPSKQSDSYGQSGDNNKQTSNAYDVTTSSSSSSITTHVDSIETIIQQLNSNNTNPGPTYNVINQHQDSQQSSTYGQDNVTPTQTYNQQQQDVSTSYNEIEQNEKQTPSPLYGQSSGGSSSSSSDSTTTNLVYKDEFVLEDHTMPEVNYNDNHASKHPTSDFNKMPAMGIAYPVDMSNMDGEESNLIHENQYPQQQQQPQQYIPQHQDSYGSANDEKQQDALEAQTVPNYLTENYQRPIASYIGVVTSQTYNTQAVPNEVIVSSHTTKVEENLDVSTEYKPIISSTYQTTNKPVKHTSPSTTSYTNRPNLVTKRPSSKKPTKSSSKRPSTAASYSTSLSTNSVSLQQQYATTPLETKNPDPVYSSKPTPAYNQVFKDEFISSGSTPKPAATRRPTKTQTNKPVSTSYITGPTTPRPEVTPQYQQYDQEVPLIVADDKLDSFVHSTAESLAAASPTQETLAYDPPVYAGTNQNQRPQYNTHKKPGFVKVQATQRPPAPTVLITPKPTTLQTAASSYTTGQQTTPLPGYGSNSYVYNSLATRRPEYVENTGNDYVGISTVNSNDFDDAGYHPGSAAQAAQAAQAKPAQQYHQQPTYVSASPDAIYPIPTDDKPAFPGYYGPTPTYPAFQVPGEKLDSPIEEETYTSPNDFIAFPPVRNPNLNMSAASSAVTSDLDLSTPAFVEDSVLKNKMNTLVIKIVESLQGNFEALSDMIDESNNTAPVNTYQASSLAPTAVTKKPTKKPSTRVTTAKPKVTTKKPVTRVSTKAPTKKTPTTRKPETTTKKPVQRRTTTTTKKPATRKPTRKVTTTTKAPAEDELVDEEDEEDVNPSDNEIVEEQEFGAGSGGRKLQCGMRPHVKSGRIVGGKGATFGAYPWQVLVRESTWLGLFTKNKCGGVLITSRYVITAAHCQPGFLASLVAVMGEFDISGDLESKRAVTKNVKRVIVHRQYDPATFENDIALLEMDSPVSFDTHIVPICMPSDVADFTGRMATVTGWGRLKYGGGVPSVLQEVQVPVIENSVCQEMFHTAGHNKKILNSFLCAGYANGQKDSCEGDSGGPLVLQRADGRYELAGTVSHGIKCAAPYLPGVYMRTTFYKPWLRSITGVK